jgi:hypothetical protein
VTPEKKYGDQFTIKVERVTRKDMGDFLDFHLTVKRKGVPATIRRWGRLEVFNSKEDVFKEKDIVSASNVKPTGRDGELSFSFRVAANDVEKAKFTYAESEGSEVGGHFYWSYLKDFVPSKWATSAAAERSVAPDRGRIRFRTSPCSCGGPGR